MTPLPCNLTKEYHVHEDSVDILDETAVRQEHEVMSQPIDELSDQVVMRVARMDDPVAAREWFRAERERLQNLPKTLRSHPSVDYSDRLRPPRRARPDLS
jgi:hypothetical protein